MTTKLFTLLLAVAASVGTMFAWDYERVQIGDLYYNLDATSQTAEVTSQNSDYPYWSTSITTANIPSSVEYNSVTYSVTSIGDRAFQSCSGLTSVTIPNSVTSIGQYAFYECSGLTSVTIGNSVTSIGSSAFSGCSGLTGELIIPNSVSSIGDWAFSGCSGLTGELIIPNSVTSIGNGAFFFCTGLTSITIPNSVTSIGDDAFLFCTGLTSINVASDNSNYCSVDGVLFNKDKTTLIQYPEGKQGAYTIPNSVTSIGDFAFRTCTGLTSVTIPNSVTSIGWEAFAWCSGLISVTIEAETPPTLVYNNAFTNTNDCPIYVPCSTIDSYKTAWSDYASRIQYVPLPYTIAIQAENGNVDIASLGNYTTCDEQPYYYSLTVIPNYGYHFAQWSDGNTDNPRTIILASDTTFTAEFAKNTYTISTISTNPEWGTTAGDTAALYLDEIEISAAPNYGYHFDKWSDGNISQQRSFILTQDTTFTATFAKNVYYITKNAEHGTISGNSSAEYLDEVTLSVSSDYGYHFAQWSDGNTDNPRTIILASDTTFTAEFAKNTYTISTTSANPELGTTIGDTTALYLDEVEISATANYGYHFDHWEIEKYREYSEYISVKPYVVKFSVPATWSNPYAWIWETGGNGHWETLSNENGMYVYRTEDDNRNIILVPNGASWANGQTNDLAITESCCYTITGEIGDYSYIANKTYDCLTPSEVQIIPRIDTVVSHSFENPLTFIVTVNQKVIAHFAKNVYSITKNAEHGSISGNSSAEYLDFVTLTVTADYGYHFTQWSDGLKDNPRIFQITQDTTFTAEFAYDRVGTCGKDMALVWSYDPNAKVLTIGNAGEFTENMRFGVEAPAEMEELVIGNSVTAIGENAFAGISTLKKVTIGESVKTIYDKAFYNCVNLETIFNYRPTPTNAYSTAFDGVDKFECKLYVLPNSIDMYKNASVWRDFYYTYAIGAEETTVATNDVTIEPQDNAATVTWPTSESAATYTIQITKDGVVVCTLIFNANGQLTGISFAPGRNGNRHAPQAVMTANGLQFTVTGLNSATHYALTLQAKDDQDAVLASYSSEFTTTGTATGVDDVPSHQVQSTKIIRNGHIFILRGDKTYTLTGQEVK